MAGHVHPYPSDPPLAAFQDAYRIIKAGNYKEELKDLSSDLWTCQGYLQKVLIGEHSVVINGQPPVPDDIRVAASNLLSAIENREPIPAGDLQDDLVKLLDPSVWLAMILPIIQKLLEKLLNG